MSPPPALATLDLPVPTPAPTQAVPWAADEWSGRGGRPDRPRAVARAVLEAVAYADVFDWPLTPAEVHRDLPLRAVPDEVAALLAVPLAGGLGETLARHEGNVTFIGREGLVAQRRWRAVASAALWPQARRYGRLIAALPFVRLVAVSGSLALDAATEAADVDLFIVTADGRLWLTRALVIAVVRLAGRRGLTLCPNYLLAESALGLPERDRFTAHELVQLVPLAGEAAWDALVRQNAWVRDLLPQRAAHPAPGRAVGGPVARLAERILGNPWFDRLERWEMRRKVRRLAAGHEDEARFGPTICKGHTGGYRRRTLAALAARLEGAAR